MLNSVAAGRVQARRALARQCLWVLLCAVLLLAFGARVGLSAGLGGGAVVLGLAVAARIALGGGIEGPNAALLRLLAAMALKWLLVGSLLAAALLLWSPSPLGLLAGVLAALVAQVLFVVRR